MKTFLKFTWFPLAMLCGILTFASYMTWKEYKIENNLVTQALDGNHYAVEILKNYEKPWKLDERVINEALKGNQNALQILKINEE